VGISLPPADALVKTGHQGSVFFPFPVSGCGNCAGPHVGTAGTAPETSPGILRNLPASQGGQIEVVPKPAIGFQERNKRVLGQIAVTVFHKSPRDKVPFQDVQQVKGQLSLYFPEIRIDNITSW